MNPYLEIVIRSPAVYIFIAAAIRLFRKNELMQLSVIDLVFHSAHHQTGQNAMAGTIIIRGHGKVGHKK